VTSDVVRKSNYILELVSSPYFWTPTQNEWTQQSQSTTTTTTTTTTTITTISAILNRVLLLHRSVPEQNILGLVEWGGISTGQMSFLQSNQC